MPYCEKCGTKISFKEVNNPQRKNKTVSMINENLAEEGVVCIVTLLKTKNGLLNGKVRQFFEK